MFYRRLNTRDRFAWLLIGLVVALAADASTTHGAPPPASIHRAVLDDDTQKLRNWLSRDIALLNARNANGMTPLHVAVANYRLRAFEFLIASGANVHLATGPARMKIERNDGTVVFRTERGQWTALHLAAFANRVEMAKVLILRGAKVDAANDLGETPLYLAAQEGHIGLARLLITHRADIDAKPKNGKFTPLMAATFNGNVETGQLLIANGAKVDPLSAAGLGLTSHVEAALRENPSALNGDGTAMTSPLYWAALNGQHRIVQMLLLRGAKTEVKDDDLRTPLIIASMTGNTTVVRTLLEHGANIAEWDRKGWTALHHAAAGNHGRTVRILLARGAKTDAKDLRNRTPADVARQNGHMDAVEIISEHSQTTSAGAALTRGK